MAKANINQAEEIEDQNQAKSILLPSDLSRKSEKSNTFNINVPNTTSSGFYYFHFFFSNWRSVLSFSNYIRILVQTFNFEDILDYFTCRVNACNTHDCSPPLIPFSDVESLDKVPDIVGVREDGTPIRIEDVIIVVTTSGSVGVIYIDGVGFFRFAGEVAW